MYWYNTKSIYNTTTTITIMKCFGGAVVEFGGGGLSPPNPSQNCAYGYPYDELKISRTPLPNRVCEIRSSELRLPKIYSQPLHFPRNSNQPCCRLLRWPRWTRTSGKGRKSRTSLRFPRSLTPTPESSPRTNLSRPVVEKSSRCS